MNNINKITRRLGGVPPDVDGRNAARAAAAGQALTAFLNTHCTDQDFMLPDLLTNLMHWCDRSKQDFDLALMTAQINYRGETTPL